jgi:hypothetical protein
MSEASNGESAASLRRVKSAVADAHKKSATKEVIEAAAVLLADALRTRAASPGELLKIKGLSARVAGPGLAKAWGQMDMPARQEALAALEHAEKPLRAKVLTVLAEELFAEDPPTAVRVLYSALPSRDLAERLPSLLQKRQSSISALGSAAIPADPFWAVLAACVAATERDTENRGALFALLRVGLRSLDDPARRNTSGAADFVAWLRANVSRQPNEFLLEVPTLLGGRGDLIGELGLGSRTGSAEATPEPRPETPKDEQLPKPRAMPEPEGRPPDQSTPAPTEEHWRALTDWAGLLRMRVETIDHVVGWGRAVEQDCRRFAGLLAYEQEKHRATNARADQLAEKIRGLEVQNEVLGGELSSTKGQLDSVAGALEIERNAHEATIAARDQAQAQWERERLELLGRIDLTATTLLQHFRDRLAEAVAKELTEGLPTEGSPVSADLGGVFLSRLHGLLRLLKREGIETGKG